jgi:hypothetical protein
MTTSGRRNLGLFQSVRELSYTAPFPRLLRVRQNVDAPRVSDIAQATATALEALRERISPGMTVAITAGSRGIHDKPAIVRAAGQWLRSAGAQPFVVPAMGSHGGATAEGQLGVLAELGMTEESLGMPIRATMETVDLGQVPGGPTAYLDRYAAAADAILVVNRIKAHTDFNGDVESGLAKITAIGLGKQRGAAGIHLYGPANLATWIPRLARRIIDTGKVLGGIAIIENAYHRTAAIEFVEPHDIGDAGEMRLLRQAKDLTATLPFDRIDVAVIDVMGKNKSGSGMDTNVIGRMMIRGSAEFDRPQITNIAVLDITDESHGNAVGLGLADFIPFRVLEKIDLPTTYINAMTSGLGGPQRAQIPMAMPTDRDAVAAAILTCGRADLDHARVVRLRDTLDLDELLVSESLRAEVEEHPRLAIVGGPTVMSFDDEGQIDKWS